MTSPSTSKESNKRTNILAAWWHKYHLQVQHTIDNGTYVFMTCGTCNKHIVEESVSDLWDPLSYMWLGTIWEHEQNVHVG